MDKKPRLTAPTLKVLAALMARPNIELSGAEMATGVNLASGTLYPILLRLEKAGWLQSRWEAQTSASLGRPRRRFYRVTAEGIIAFRETVRELEPALGRLAWT